MRSIYHLRRHALCLLALLCGAQCRGVLDSQESVTSPGVAPLKLAFVQQGVNGNADIYLLTEGSRTAIQLTTAPNVDSTPVWSPDGGSIAFVTDRDHPGDYDIYRMHEDGSQQMALTTGSGNNVEPVWSPDGSKIAFLSDRDGVRRVYLMHSDGTAQRPLLSFPSLSPTWSPNGTRLAVVVEKSSDYGIYSVKTDGTQLRRLSGPAPTYDQAPIWSPKGDRIIFESIIEGMPQIYMVSPDGHARARLSPVPWGGSPLLAPTGDRVAFVGPGGIFVIGVSGTHLVPLVHTGGHGMPWCWSPDGNALVMTDGAGVLYRVRLNQGRLERLTEMNAFAYRAAWAPQ